MSGDGADPTNPALSADGANPADHAPHVNSGIDPATIDASMFERLVIDELDALPDEIVDGIENVVFVTEDRPEDGS